MNRPPRSRRQGIALVEVLVALALLGVLGGAWVALAHERARARAQLEAREEEQRAAAILLMGLEAKSRGELEALLARDLYRGGVAARVTSRDRRLFEVQVRDTLSGASILRTAIYRAADDRHAR
jgi:hypothetical protein